MAPFINSLVQRAWMQSKTEIQRRSEALKVFGQLVVELFVTE